MGNLHHARKSISYCMAEYYCLELSIISGAFFCNFQIPANLLHLWAYIREMYQLDAFLQSNPADQDIINIYKDQLGVKTVKHEELASPRYTTSVPSTLAA